MTSQGTLGDFISSCCCDTFVNVPLSETSQCEPANATRVHEVINCSRASLASADPGGANVQSCMLFTVASDIK